MHAVVPWTSSAVIKAVGVLDLYCVFDGLFGSDPMGAAGVPGYEVTPFLASTFRSQAGVQFALVLLAFTRSNDTMVQAAVAIALATAVLNDVVDHFTLGSDLFTAYLFSTFLVLLALPKLRR